MSLVPSLNDLGEQGPRRRNDGSEMESLKRHLLVSSCSHAICPTRYYLCSYRCVAGILTSSNMACRRRQVTYPTRANDRLCVMLSLHHHRLHHHRHLHHSCKQCQYQHHVSAVATSLTLLLRYHYHCRSSHPQSTRLPADRHRHQAQAQHLHPCHHHSSAAAGRSLHHIHHRSRRPLGLGRSLAVDSRHSLAAHILRRRNAVVHHTAAVGIRRLRSAATNRRYRASMLACREVRRPCFCPDREVGAPSRKATAVAVGLRIAAPVVLRGSESRSSYHCDHVYAALLLLGVGALGAHLRICSYHLAKCFGRMDCCCRSLPSQDRYADSDYGHSLAVHQEAALRRPRRPVVSASPK